MSPGPDFFLIVRSALAQGWRKATGLCLGVALANGLFIVLALSGFSILQPGSALFSLLQWGGCLYLLYLGWRFLRSPGTTLALPDADAPAAAPVVPSWGAGLRMGLTSGLLNPKNGLFYASLFSVLAGAKAGRSEQIAYGTWMFCAVLAWNLLIAAATGHRSIVARFTRHLPTVERAAGILFVLIAFSVALASLPAR